MTNDEKLGFCRRVAVARACHQRRRHARPIQRVIHKNLEEDPRQVRVDLDNLLRVLHQGVDSHTPLSFRRRFLDAPELQPIGQDDGRHLQDVGDHRQPTRHVHPIPQKEHERLHRGFHERQHLRRARHLLDKRLVSDRLFPRRQQPLDETAHLWHDHNDRKRVVGVRRWRQTQTNSGSLSQWQPRVGHEGKKTSVW